ncbi:MAG TPA: zinc-dependent metalloprotease [Acidimicrobiia bacterium]
MTDDDPMDGLPDPFGPEGFDATQFFAQHGLDLSQVLGIFNAAGPVNWEVARQVAESICLTNQDGEGALDDPDVDSARAERLATIVQAAQTNVAATTGLAESAALEVQCVNRRGWTVVTLDGLKPVLEALASRMASPFGAGTQPFGMQLDDPSAIDDDPDMLAGIMSALAPVLFGVQAGSLSGLLAHHALGQYDLPLPLAAPPKLAFVVANIEQFARDWDLEFDDLAFALASREVVHAAQRSVPWVRERLVRLATEYVSGYELRPDVLEDQFSETFSAFDDIEPESLIAKLQAGEMPAIDIDATELLAHLRTPAQEPILAELQRFGAVLGGYADAVIDMLGTRVGPGGSRIEEALRRHRVECGAATEFVDLMLGLKIDRTYYDKGRAFCQGVIDRAGIDGLNRVWERESMLPTENELDAPGLWLARIELDLDD